MTAITERFSLDGLVCDETLFRAGFLAIGWGTGYMTAADAYGADGAGTVPLLMVGLGFVLMALAEYRR